MLRLNPTLAALLGCAADHPHARSLLAMSPGEDGTAQLSRLGGDPVAVRVGRVDLPPCRALLLVAEAATASVVGSDAEGRLRTLVDTITDAVIASDAQGCITEVNRAALALFGWQPEALIGRPLDTVLLPSLGTSFEPLLYGERSPSGETLVQGLRADGRRFAAEVAVADTATQAGVLRVHCVRDATERLRFEQGLRDAKDAAERANHAKSDFLAQMSHELRTPLNAVIGMAGLLLDSPLDDQSRRHAETLRNGADVLMQLIGDVLDFSKLDAGRLQFETIAFDPEALIHSVLDLLTPNAHGKGLELSASIAPGIPRLLSGDPARIRQVLINLIGNAVKFTHRGAVSVDMRRAPPGPATPPGLIGVAIEIRDTGIGIEPDLLPHLFKEFSQLDSSISRRFGGTGLGLSICQRLVTGMGGRIEASSKPGQGSAFRFTLQLPECDTARPPPAPIMAPSRASVPGRPNQRRDAGRLRLLVAEDNRTNQVVIRAMIERLGHSVTVVGDGRQALAALGEQPFDLVLMDVMMPNMDGMEAVRAIRALAPPLCDLPVFGLTAHIGPDDHASFRAAGMDNVLTKPLTARALATALAPVVERLSDPVV